MTSFLLHADDFGLSSGTNQSIIESIEKGHVSSVSLLANGDAVREAVEYLKTNSDVRVSIHLNLQEGVPAAKPDDIPLLVTKGGHLDASFQRLFWFSTTKSKTLRKELSQQIGIEFNQQIEKSFALLGSRLDMLRLDSHSHIHAIPIVFDTILSLDTATPIEYIRILKEPTYFARNTTEWARPFGLNAIKHSILNYFSEYMIDKLTAHNIGHNDFLIGILHSGKMTKAALIEGLAACRKVIEPSRAGLSSIVEVLIHPGQATPNENKLWADRADLWKFYSSSDRRAELELSKDVELKAILSNENMA
ncbi:MAG: ChbG/HpnK family deacetylase [Pseudomonadota bacterium]